MAVKKTVDADVTNEETEDAQVFDLVAALAGRSYPEETVPVFIDEGLMYEYSKLSEAAVRDPANKEKEAERDAMLESFKDLVLRVEVKGTPRHVRKAIREKVLKEFPPKKNSFGKEEFNEDMMEALDQLTWEAHVVAITPPEGQGETFTPSSEVIKALRDSAPDASIVAIETAINSLTEGAQSGYEQTVQAPDFLSLR